MTAYLLPLEAHDAIAALVALKRNQLDHCTLQLWMPDTSSEDGIYTAKHGHGIAVYDLPLQEKHGLLATIHKACLENEGFASLSAIATGYWPVVLTACRHYRLPVPPQFWIEPLYAPPEA